MKPLHGLYAFFFPSTVNWSSSINSQIILVHNNNQITVKNVIKKVVLWLKNIYVGSWCYIVYAWVEGKYTRNTIHFFCIHHFAVVRILEWRIVAFFLVYILYYSLADSLYYYLSIFTIFKQYFVISPCDVLLQNNNKNARNLMSFFKLISKILVYYNMSYSRAIIVYNISSL